MASLGDWHLHEPIDEDTASTWLRATKSGELAVVRRLRDPALEPWLRDEIELRRKLVAVPGLVPLLDAGDEGGVPWLAQAWVDGLNLRDVLVRCHRRRVPIPMELSVYVIAQTARHFHALHAAIDERGPVQAVQRDVSPATIHLGLDGLVRIPTLLYAQSRHSRAKLAPGELVGRYSYMSPEAAHGDRLDHLSDQFALGIVLYELVTGVRPYRGSEIEIHKAARAAAFAKPRSHNRHIPEELEEAIVQAMHVDRNRRFDSCEQLAEELDEILALFDEPANASTMIALLRRLDDALAS